MTDDVDQHLAASGEDEVVHSFAVRARFRRAAEDADRAEADVRPLREFGSPAADMVRRMPYPAVNTGVDWLFPGALNYWKSAFFSELSEPAVEVLISAFDGLVPPGLQHYWKAAYVRELTDEAIAAHMEHGPKVPAVNSTVHVYPINGAVHDVPPDATAFGHRDATFAPVIAGMWPDPADNERNIAWVREYYAAIAPHSEPGGYVNFASADDQPRVAENYGENYARLREVKRRYDPGNLFRINQNIEP